MARQKLSVSAVFKTILASSFEEVGAAAVRQDHLLASAEELIGVGLAKVKEVIVNALGNEALFFGVLGDHKVRFSLSLLEDVLNAA